MNTLRLYLSRQAAACRAMPGTVYPSPCLAGWPTVVGIGLRAFAYRLIMHLRGIVAVEKVCASALPARFAWGARLPRRGRLPPRLPNGIDIGDNTW